MTVTLLLTVSVGNPDHGNIRLVRTPEARRRAHVVVAGIFLSALFICEPWPNEDDGRPHLPVLRGHHHHPAAAMNPLKPEKRPFMSTIVVAAQSGPPPTDPAGPTNSWGYQAAVRACLKAIGRRRR